MRCLTWHLAVRHRPVNRAPREQRWRLAKLPRGLRQFTQVQHWALADSACMSLRTSLTLIVVGAFSSVADAVPSMPNWVPAGPSTAQMHYFIDSDSVRQQGDVTHYRLFGRGHREESRLTTVEAEVGVQCSQMRRVQYVTTTRWDGGVRTGTASQMEAVAADSRMESEMQVACRLAAQRTSKADMQLAGPTVHSVRNSSPLGQPNLRWTGTGFAVSRDIIITNNHVARGCINLQVMQGSVSYPARLLAADAESDLAALSVPGVSLQALELSPDAQELGEAITVLGYPLANVLGAGLRVTTGIVSALTGVGGESRTMQISAAVQSGNSGGPVLDQYGAVAGVVVKKLDLRLGAENISFAVQLQTLRSFLTVNSLAHLSSRAPASKVLSVAQVVRKTAASVLLITCA